MDVILLPLSAHPPVSRVDLRDGSAVRIRPISPADRSLLVEGFEQLSPESRYKRFFSPVTRLSERHLDYLTDVDHHDHEALLALAGEEDAAVGVARYVRTEDGIAEPAIVVVDEWQGRGLATILLDALADRAREEGVHTFIAPVLAQNTGAIRLFERLGDATVRHDGLEVELTIPLGEAKGASAPLHRLLREVAMGTARPALAFWQRLTTSTAAPAQSRNLVVVGLPTGEALDRLAEVAADYAAATGAELSVVASQRFLLDDREELAERVAAVAGRLEERGLRVETCVRRGDLAASLLDEAVRTGARLIVVDGSEPDASTPLLTSTWDHVAHHAPCNVLVAR